MSTKQREEYEDALLGKSDTDMINDITESEITPYDLLQPRTHSDIRNRYLARLGAVSSCPSFFFFCFSVSNQGHHLDGTILGITRFQ